MSAKLLSLSAALCLTLSGAATAQEATTAETPPAAEAEAAPDAQQGQADQLLDLGQPVEQGPRLGERYSRETFGDWELACIRTEQEEDPCSLLQIMTDDAGNAVAEMSLFRLAGGGQAVAGATVVVPLETLLPAQLTIAVDDGNAKRYGYSFCNQIGCVAQIGLTEADVNAFKRGATATVSLVPAPAPDQQIDLTLSLTGFTAGFDAVDVVEN